MKPTARCHRSGLQAATSSTRVRHCCRKACSMASPSPVTGMPLTIGAAIEPRTVSSNAATVRAECTCCHRRSSGRCASRAATRACAYSRDRPLIMLSPPRVRPPAGPAHAPVAEARRPRDRPAAAGQRARGSVRRYGREWRRRSNDERPPRARQHVLQLHAPARAPPGASLPRLRCSARRPREQTAQPRALARSPRPPARWLRCRRALPSRPTFPSASEMGQLRNFRPSL